MYCLTKEVAGGGVGRWALPGSRKPYMVAFGFCLPEIVNFVPVFLTCLLSSDRGTPGLSSCMVVVSVSKGGGRWGVRP